MTAEERWPTDLTVGLLRELVSHRTVSESSNMALQAWFKEHLEHLGASVRVIEGATGRANLLACIGPDTAGGVMFAGHTDVVPAGEGWATDPWVLEVNDGRAVGRGTADMKGFFACLLTALVGLEPHQLQRPIRVLASYDEEIGCIGIRHCLPEVSASTNWRPDIVIVGEPTSMRPRYTHLGKELFSVTVTGPGGHSSRAGQVPSAITYAVSLLTEIARIQATQPPFDGDAVPFSLNVGTLTGGAQANVLAPSCRFEFEVRVDSHHSVDELLGPFFALVGRADEELAPFGGGVAVARLGGYPALRADETLPAVREAVRLADVGPAVELGFGTEAGLIAAAIDAPVLICGPGDIAVAHRPDEFVPLDELDRCVLLMRQLIDAFCTAP